MIARKCDRCGSFYIPDDSMKTFPEEKQMSERIKETYCV